MKKFTFLCLAGLTVLNVSAQNYAERMVPSLNPPLPSVMSLQNAMWDVQLDVPAPSIAGGLAGVIWTGTEFWTARWANDSVFTADATGALTGFFKIPGVTGIRSMTTDGTFIYAGANTTAIYKIDKTTRTLVSTINTAVPNCRYVTYDPTLNSGAGGFWAGTFSSDIEAVSMSGTALNTLFASSHGLQGIYGLVYDSYSLGGPFLWAYDQTPTGDGAMLVQLNITTGVPTGLTHNTLLDLAGGTSTGIAGGAYIANNYVANTASLIGILQGVSLFSYELATLTGINTPSVTEYGYTVYPNPATDMVRVNFKTQNAGMVSVTVKDINGRTIEIKNVSILSSGDQQIKLNAEKYSKGFYFVDLNVDGKVLTQKLVVR